jgi:hypothetical protein
MSDDEFSKQAGKAIQATVTGGAALVAGPPGVVLAVAAATTFSVFDALAGGNDEALREVRVAALEDEMIAVRDKLRALEARLHQQGSAPDRQDPLTQSAVASEFVRSVSEARTAEKREALVNATVAQFDPSKGSPATRDYWLRRLRDLPEIEVSFVLLLAQHGQVAFADGKMFQAHGGRAMLLPFGTTDTVAYSSLGERMTNAGHGSLVEKTQALVPIDSRAVTATAYVLTRDGSVLMSLCKGD